MRRKWVAVAVGGCLVVGLGLYAGDFFDEEVGSFGVQDVCENLDPDREVVEKLRQVLPERGEYDFYAEGSTGSKFGPYCHIRHEGKNLMTVLINYTDGSDPDAWLKRQVERKTAEGARFGWFKAGYGGVSSTGGGAIYLPCFKDHPEGLGSLSVSVNLRQGSRAAPKETKAAAEFLVRRAAAFAHKDAGCDLPSRL
ncbi:hypothetical protein ABT354_15305 [Streptomyces sp. NPDC000594]|uniref:hypothetical protein n=1 Tax=Streptomyces sp. NPDC000594 TaxID=3154261 RepID=UPI003333E723